MATEYHLLLGLTSESTAVVTPPGTTNYYLLLALTSEQGVTPPPPPPPAVVAEGVPGGTVWYEVVGGYVGPHRPPNLRTRRGW